MDLELEGIGAVLGYDEDYTVIRSLVPGGPADKSEKIKGGFYDFELTKVSGDIFRIEKIIKTRKINGKIQHFVRWKGFNENYDSWIDAEDITRDF